MAEAIPKSTSRKVNGYVKAVLRLEEVRRKREERYERYVRPLDRKRDVLAAEVDRRMRALIGTQQARRGGSWARSTGAPRLSTERSDSPSGSGIAFACFDPNSALAGSREGDSMSERIIRSETHLTIVEAHPYHRYISDHRPRGNAIVQRAFDTRCPRCREQDTVAKRA